MKWVWLIILYLFSAGAQAQPVPEITPRVSDTILIHVIYVQGNKHTRKKVVLRELGFKEGERIAAERLPHLIEESKSRLASSGLFITYLFTVDTLSENTVDIYLRLTERWYIIPEPTFQLADQNFNVWWNEHNGNIRRTIIGLVLKHKNFRGNRENLNITAQVGYTKRLGAEYINPYADKTQRHGFGLGVSMEESQELFYQTDSNKLRFVKYPDSYITRTYTGTVSWLFRPAFSAVHMLQLSYRQSEIADTVASLNPDYFLNGSRSLKMLELKYRYELNETDNWNYPLEGTKLITQLGIRIGLAGVRQQVFATVEGGRYFQPWKGWYASFILRGKLSFPERQPYALQTALGTKYDYVRGYEYYVMDGPHFGVLRFDWKRELVHTAIRNIPLRYLTQIPVRIYPKVFADAGYAWNSFAGNSFLNNKTLYSVGVGVDIFTAYDIKIRLEYAINHLGQKDLFLHFRSE